MQLRRTTMTSALALAGSLVLAGPSFADSHDGDLDCENFDYQEQAQALYDSYPSDVHRLDDDDDGTACETLPSDPEGRDWVVLEHTDDVVDLAELIATSDECSDFATQRDAQFVLYGLMNTDMGDGDPRGLDEDGDGIACEGYFESTSAPSSGQVSNSPSGGVATGGGSTSGIENQGMLAGGALALAAGAGGLILAGRREARD